MEKRVWQATPQSKVHEEDSWPLFKRISYRPPKIFTQGIKAKRSDYTKFIRLCHQSKVKVIQIDEFTVVRGIMPKMTWTERENLGSQFTLNQMEDFQWLLPFQIQT